MSKFITDQKLKELINSGDIIENGNENNVEGIKYDFSLGNRLLKASFKTAVDFDKVKAKEKVITPGELVFVLSKEKINLPIDISIILNPKRKLAHEGISVLGGLSVDPLYSGYLVIGLYNYSGREFKLIPGNKLISGLFVKLDEEEVGDFPKPYNLDDFPSSLVKMIDDYQPISTSGLSTQIENLSNEISDLKRQIDADEKWKKDFQDGLSRIEKALEKEITNRTEADKSIIKEIWIPSLTVGIPLFFMLLGLVLQSLFK